MGVTGLTTYLSKFGEKYSESIYLRQGTVVVDGCNLMFYLYFDGSLTKSGPHLFGGDCFAYCQHVREYFLKLKMSDVLPIVIFDGAYESAKLRTAMKRFGKALKDNVQNKIPGKTYTTVLIKIAFLEIMVEQNIDHYQTEFEADDTIAFIAKKLNCPVLSSDSDFFVYANLTTIPLNTIDFRRVQLKKDELRKQGLDKNIKPFCLVGKFVTLRKICQKEFKISDCRLLSLIAVVIGNDQVTSRIFSKFQNQKGGAKVSRHERITFLLKWFGRQRSYETALQAMIITVKEADRDNVRQLVNQVVSNYMGDGGEEFVWKLVQLSTTFQTSNKMINDSKTSSCIKSEHDETDMSTTDGVDGPKETESLCDLLEDLSLKDEQNHEESQSEEESDDDENELTIDKPKLPAWYLKPHTECVLPTYLLKLFYNRAIFCTPQVEITMMPSSHAICVPIIQVTGGIVCGPGSITLITRDKSNIEKLNLSTVTSLPCCDPLPCVSSLESIDFRLSLTHETRLGILFEALQMTPEDIKFIHEWPPFTKFWIAICLYYVRKLRKTHGFYMAVAVALSIIMSCLKQYSFSSSSNPKEDDKSNSSNEESISKLLKRQTMDSTLTKLFKSFDSSPEIKGKSFWKSYDIARVFYFSQYQSVILHTFMLNALLGHPLKSPKLSTLNCHIVYNLCTSVVDKYYGQISQFLDKEVDPKSPLKKILLKFIQIAVQDEAMTICDMPIDQNVKSRKNDKKNSGSSKSGGEKLNRFMALATEDE